MYIGEQIINPTNERIQLSRQLGCEHIVVDTRPAAELENEDGTWDTGKVAAFRKRIEDNGIALDVMALDIGSILLDSIHLKERADLWRSKLQANIRAAAEAGIPCLKYNVQMVGITRSGMSVGRGGVECSQFKLADYTPEKDAQFSYWGVGHPGGGAEGADIHVNATDTKEACGQTLATNIPGVSEQQGWDALEYLVETLVPIADECGVRLAGHPHDPAYPPGGLNGVHHNLGSIEGIRKYLDFAPESMSHGLNFCQGTIAEMSENPTEYVLKAIQEFGARQRIFMVHFRNIDGGYLDFSECFPDEGSVDMAACIRAYRKLLQGEDQLVGTRLVENSNIRAVGFTGSLRGGRALYALCHARPEPIPFYGELGSINPVFCLPKALEERAADIGAGWAASLTLGAGQFCTNPGVVVGIKGASFDTLIKSAVSALKQAAPQKMLTDAIQKAYGAGVANFAARMRELTANEAVADGRDSLPVAFQLSAKSFIENQSLQEEVFGSAGILVECETQDEMLQLAENLQGQLTATLHCDNEDHTLAQELAVILEEKAGRLLCNGFPTGVEVSPAMMHGGPYPASTDARATSVGTLAIARWLRPVSFQNFPNELLHEDLRQARRLFHEVAASLPIVDFHNHLEPTAIAEDRQWESIGENWLEGDHYKWRAMRWNGIPEHLVSGAASYREKYDAFAKTVPHCVGNPIYHWTHLELRRYFGWNGVFGPETADEVWELTSDMLSKPAFSARGLLTKMNVVLVGTTDDPNDTLQAHKAARSIPGLTFELIPSFRPDAALLPRSPGFAEFCSNLETSSGVKIEKFDDLVAALLHRLDDFISTGCKAADHGLNDLRAFSKRSPRELDIILRSGQNNWPLTACDEADFKAALLIELGKAYATRNIVMQFHLGVLRDNNTRLFAEAGHNAGGDCISDTHYGAALVNLLDQIDCQTGLPRTILYCLNPSMNEMLVSIAGSFQDGSVPGKVQAGPGWWFNDQLDGMERQLTQVAQLGLLSRFVGMLTDSKSLLSFPRHEYYRRLVCRMVGRWIEAGHMPEQPELSDGLVRRICYENARDWFCAERVEH
eukprot:g811.t1